MTQLDEAVARYHKLVELDRYKDLQWAEALRDQIKGNKLAQGSQQVLPVLRPHFITRRQYASLVRASEALLSAIDRVKRLALSTPALLSRMELLPAEKMLAAVDPRYPFTAVTSLLDTQFSNGSLYFMKFNVGAPAGVASSEVLGDIFYNLPIMKEFRKRYELTKVGGTKHLLSALLQAYKAFGKKRHPRIAILEFRQPFQVTQTNEYLLLAETFRKAGYPAEVVSPDQLEYRGGVLRSGDYEIDLIYRRLTVQEFLVRFDLSHPLVKAYKDGAVCMVNSFRAELAHKRAIFDLLTDESLTAGFPAAERKAIKDHIPWTRVVSATRTTYKDGAVDLPDFIVKNRETLVLRPNDIGADQHAFIGSETDEKGWERALRTAMRYSYVVQERVETKSVPFPLLQYGSLEIRNMQVDVQPHIYLGKVYDCSSWLTDASSGFSTLAGLAPTFILESKS
ncbi:MAG: hypothetical protein KIT09_11760 [Bryobacteraceae bacterium]|nr:hypothetical protein [Bryobacteraceae bacterium]